MITGVSRGGSGVFSILAPCGPHGTRMENRRVGGDFPHPQKSTLSFFNPHYDKEKYA